MSANNNLILSLNLLYHTVNMFNLPVTRLFASVKDKDKDQLSIVITIQLENIGILYIDALTQLKKRLEELHGLTFATVDTCVDGFKIELVEKE